MTAYAKGSATSQAAAHSMEDAAPQLRVIVMNEIRARGGMTCDEVEVALDLAHQTASARIRELVLMGLVVDSGSVRSTRSERKASVWVPAPPPIGLSVAPAGLSVNIQVGKAAEHLVVADLILQGFNAYLTDAGVPYDVVVDVNGTLKRLQVKSKQTHSHIEGQGEIYRFSTRRGNHTTARIRSVDCDFYAFVALDIRAIAYLTIEEMQARSGQIKQTVDLKSRHLLYAGRVYSNGTQRIPEWGAYLQDFKEFSRCVE